MTLSPWIAFGVFTIGGAGELDQKTLGALKELDGPIDPVIYGGFIGPTLRNQPSAYFAKDMAIQRLIETKQPVETELRKRADSSRHEVSLRAVYVLAHRGDQAAIPYLKKWVRSKDDTERFLAWYVWDRALRARLAAPTDFDLHLRLYADETNGEVKEQMEWFFGSARAKPAVKPLLEQLESRPFATTAIWALGMIGDPIAVPEIIKAYETKGFNEHYHIQALGRLATPEAVDFLIRHIDQYCAPEALCQTKSPKALPALKKHLEKLQKLDPVQVRINLTATRIAVIRLDEKDAAGSFIAIAEDAKEHHAMRFAGLNELYQFDHKPHHARVLKLYRKEKDHDLKRACIWLLEDCSLAGTTDAMIDHAFQYETHTAWTMADHATCHYLLRAINKRLDTTFRDLESVRNYVRDKAKPKEKW